MNAIVPSPKPNSSAEATTDSEDLGFALPGPLRLSRRWMIFIACLIAALFAGAFTLVYLPRRSARQALERAAIQTSRQLRRVTVVRPKAIEGSHQLMLVGNIQPLEEAVIYSRANGYLQRWFVDMGAKVRTGTLLAIIETPEIDQELMQARATLAEAMAKRVQAHATSELSDATLVRTGKLANAGVASQQELEESKAKSQIGAADVVVADATIAAQRANIHRLSDMKNFARVTAPFAGTIVARTVDRGSLVTAGTGTPLFRLAATDIVRIFVQAPQDVAPLVTVGSVATVRLREFPGVQFHGTVARTAGALDPNSRTLSAEIRILNRDGKLLAGMYAETELTLSSSRRAFEIPSTALMADAAGLRIAVVRPDNTLQLRKIELERDLGATIQIATGLQEEERVVQIATAELRDGERVEAIN